MARVKICGITSQASLEAAHGADWVGLNFFPRSPRFITPERAASLTGGPARVGLFVDPTDDELADTLSAVSLDTLQIYADRARAAFIRERFGLPVWRAVGVSSRDDLPAESEAVDGWIIEAKAPPGATRPGGNAASFDWSILRGWSSSQPWILAGGLHPANVEAAIAASGATAVDVASGVERQPGVKDPALCRAFIDAAHALTFS